MGNCLVTKLKENVNNDNLDIFGSIKIQIQAVDNPQSRSKTLTLEVAGEDAEIYTDNGGTFNFTQSPVQVSGVSRATIKTGSPAYIVVANANFNLIMENKYGLKQFMNESNSSVPYSNIVFQDDYIKYATGLTRLKVSYQQNASFDIATLPSTMTKIDVGATNVIGSIANIGHMKVLEELILNGTQISGSVEDMANSMVANGKTSGVLLLGYNGIITYGGTPITSYKNVFFGSSMSGQNPTTEETNQGWCLRNYS